jgi:O-antigen/teichoic acid export membrane protein
MTARKLIINSFASRVFAAIASMLTIVLVSRWFGAELRGEVSLALSWVAFLAVVNDFVTGGHLINLSPELPRKHILSAGRLWSLMVAAIFLLFAVFLNLIPGDYAWLIALCGLTLGVYNIHGSLLIGYKQVNMRNLAFALYPLLVLVCLVNYNFQNPDTIITTQTYLSFVLVSYLILCVGTGYRMMKTKANAQQGAFKTAVKQIFSFGMMSQSGHLVQFLNYRIAFYLIPVIFGMEELGLYANTIVLAESIWMIGGSLGQIAHMKLVNTSDKKAETSMVLKYLRTSVLMSSIAVLLLCIIPDSFWVWLLKKEFKGLNLLLIAFAPAVIAQSWTVLISHYYHASNRFKVLLTANSIGLLTGIGGLLVFGHYFGLSGAAFGSSLGFVASFAYSATLFCKEHKLSFWQLVPNTETISSLTQVLRDVLRRL